MRENCGEELSLHVDSSDLSTSSLQQVLLGAARLWCRAATWPTDEEIADETGLPLSSIFSLQNGAVGLRERLARTEVEELMQAYRQCRRTGLSASAALETAARRRTAELAAIDPDLIYLPLLACVTARARHDHRLACTRGITEVLAEGSSADAT